MPVSYTHLDVYKRQVWMDAYTAVLTLFLWACGICTAIILWQGKRVLDTIMKGEPFTLANAANLRRAAVCCFIISGACLLYTSMRTISARPGPRV